ncbi:hypothetical protein QQ045_024482 [Rhodiola kirilowii]
MVHPAGNDEVASSSTRKSRGPTLMQTLIDKHNKDGTKEPVTIENDGTIAGEVGKSFRSYIGNVELFDVPQNDLTGLFKKTEMRGSIRIWRNFKSELANQYMFGPKQGEDPREMYYFIDPDHWKTFVEYHSTKEAIKIRETNIARGKSNPYQHTMSRSGYKKARADVLVEKKAQLEDEGLIGSGDEHIIHVGRHEVWKRGHQRRNKEYIRDFLRGVAEKIISFKFSLIYSIVP